MGCSSFTRRRDKPKNYKVASITLCLGFSLYLCLRSVVPTVQQDVGIFLCSSVVQCPLSISKYLSVSVVLSVYQQVSVSVSASLQCSIIASFFLCLSVVQCSLSSSRNISLFVSLQCSVHCLVASSYMSLLFCTVMFSAKFTAKYISVSVSSFQCSVYRLVASIYLYLCFSLVQ